MTALARSRRMADRCCSRRPDLPRQSSSSHLTDRFEDARSPRVAPGLRRDVTWEEGGVSTQAETVPSLLPARMLNEFAYCPRLFYLEWSDQQWADNDDTEEGRFHHRRVDEPAGRVGAPDDGELPWRARSVLVSSSRLGLSARIDVVEAAGGRVVPVDVKKGKPPGTPEGAWEPERVQLCVQGLLLREEGFRTDHGELYFAGARRRVRVDFDEQLVARTLELVEAARAVAASDSAPPPLVDSPKCPRCSLVGICLPDEVNQLATRSARAPRRLLPSDPAGGPLYVTEQGGRIGLDHGRVLVMSRDREVVSEVRLIDVTQVCLFGNVQISTQALRRLLVSDIPVTFFSFGGRFEGIAHGLPTKNVMLRRSQVIVAAQGGVRIAAAMIAGKIANGRTLLRRNARHDVKPTLAQLRRLQDAAASASSVESLLGIEGTAARLYFGALPSLLRGQTLPGEPFAFEGRNRRPPRDPVNCLLSFVYALLVKDLTVACMAVGLDPYLGIYHRPRFGRPAMALDLAEEMRPLVADSVVIGLINNGEVKPSHFLVRAGGVALTSEGRRTVLKAYERRLRVELTHPLFGYKVSYRRLLELQVRVLAAHLLGEIDRYVPVMTR